MADEFEITLKGKITNGYYSTSWGSVNSRKFDQAAIGAHATIVSVGYAAEEILGVGDVTTQGYLYLKNLDTVNFVTYGPTATGVMVEFGKLKAGEEAWMRVMPSGSVRAQADPDGSGAVNLQMILFED